MAKGMTAMKETAKGLSTPAATDAKAPMGGDSDDTQDFTSTEQARILELFAFFPATLD